MTSVKPKINQREVSHHLGWLVSHIMALMCGQRQQHENKTPYRTHSKKNPGKYLLLINAMPQLHNCPVVFVLQHR